MPLAPALRAVVMTVAAGTLLAACDDNQAPEALPDTAAVLEDGEVLVPVLANDSDADGDALTLSSVWAFGHDVQIRGDAVLVRPDPDFNGRIEVRYGVDDGEAKSESTLMVDVSAVNDPPFLTGRDLTIEPGAMVLIQIEGGDKDGAPLTHDISRAPRGTLSNTAAAPRLYRFEHAPGAVTSDSFEVTVSDGELSTTATYTVGTKPAPGQPKANPMHLRTVAGTSLSFQYDGTGAGLSAEIVTATEHGTLTQYGLSGTYTPEPGFVGIDRGEFRIIEGWYWSTKATVEIEVQPAP